MPTASTSMFCSPHLLRFTKLLYRESQRLISAAEEDFKVGLNLLLGGMTPCLTSQMRTFTVRSKSLRYGATTAGSGWSRRKVTPLTAGSQQRMLLLTIRMLVTICKMGVVLQRKKILSKMLKSTVSHWLPKKELLPPGTRSSTCPSRRQNAWRWGWCSPSMRAMFSELSLESALMTTLEQFAADTCLTVSRSPLVQRTQVQRASDRV